MISIILFTASATRAIRLTKRYIPRIFSALKTNANKKMPKIDTLDALDDEMTSILNTL